MNPQQPIDIQRRNYHTTNNLRRQTSGQTATTINNYYGTSSNAATSW